MGRFSQILIVLLISCVHVAYADITISGPQIDLTGSSSDYSSGSPVLQATGNGSNNLGTGSNLSSQSTFWFTGTSATLVVNRAIGQLVVGNDSGSSILSINSPLLANGAVLVANSSTLNMGNQPLTLSGTANLSGTGTISLNSTNILFSSGAMGGISPGSSLSLGSYTFANNIGTLTLSSGGSGSALQLSTSSISTFDIASDASYDQVNLGGTNVLYSGQLVLNFTDTPNAGTTYQLFQNNGTTTGTFSSITSNLSGYTFSFDESLGLLTIETIPEPPIVWYLGLALFAFAASRVALHRKATSSS